MLDHGKIVFKNYMINTLVDLLSEPVSGQVARSRNRFITLLADPMKSAEAKRIALLEQYAVLTDGKLVLDEKTQEYPLRDKEGFEKAFAELSQQEFDVPCVGEHLVDFQRVHTMLDTTAKAMSVSTTSTYEAIMQSFEAWAKKD